VAVWDPSIYVGAQLVVGAVGSSDIEVVEVVAANPGTSWGAVFVNAHASGEPITGATFPVRQTTDPLFTQDEMLAYLSTAANDFLLDCPLVYNVADINVAPAAQNAALPADCMQPERMAVAQYPLRETSQANLDSMFYNWNSAAASNPSVYFRDKTGLQNFGIWPRANNVTTVECVYRQRQAETMGLADGFLIPDCFLIYIKYRTLSFAFSKDGEARQAGLARYFQSRYEFGIKVSRLFLEAAMDPNLQLAPQ
jgi:hypothetical protein